MNQRGLVDCHHLIFVCVQISSFHWDTTFYMCIVDVTEATALIHTNTSTFPQKVGQVSLRLHQKARALEIPLVVARLQRVNLVCQNLVVGEEAAPEAEGVLLQH